ncbi:MAG: hypothetical protein GH155_07690, partial [Spirochaeta sp.]|nr:hypothetical protein [Spirochaeta sp.]
SSSPVVKEDGWEDDWKRSSSLIEVPFLLSPDNRILVPEAGSALSDNGLSFLSQNRDFLTGRAEIPIFKNIALEYKDEIIEDFDKEGPVLNAAQQAKSRFEQDESIKKKVYEEAERKGQSSLSRTVSPDTEQANKSEVTVELKSILITENLKFDEVTEEGESGIIPRIINGRLVLLFWNKEINGFITGSTLALDVIKRRIAGILPDVYTKNRILTILDEQGKPLITPFQEQKRDYSRPFAAREISENLPLWEAAVYLTDPDIISSRVSFITTVMWTLILILFTSIIGGGVLVLKTLNSEIVLARQKTTFVANVSHELKTPLTSIRIFAEMLKQGKQPDREKQARYFDIMVSETERLTRLINNVLDFSRMDSGKKHYHKKRVDINRLCRKLVENEHIRAEQNGFIIKFKSTLGEQIEGIAYADEEAIKQALLNLLSNAEKYAEKEKNINVETGRENNFLYIDVKDRGRGIPSRHAKKIFSEFYRIDDSLTARVKGTGLGLSIARIIIRDHGGDIIFLPRDGGGSVFRIKLPALGYENE